MFTTTHALIGHRGLGKGVIDGQIENTLGSFTEALEYVDWVEVDVRRTCDDELMVAHDAAFPDGTFLADITAREAIHRGTLSLAELLDRLPSHGGVVFDVKSSMEDAARSPAHTTAGLLGPIARAELHRRPVAALSFDPAVLRQLRERVPAMPLGFTTWLHYPAGHAVAAAAHLDVQLVAIHAGSLWPNKSAAATELRPLEQVVERVHESRRQLMVWCPTTKQGSELVDAGVDALILDDVPRRAPALAGNRPVPAGRA